MNSISIYCKYVYIDLLLGPNIVLLHLCQWLMKYLIYVCTCHVNKTLDYNVIFLFHVNKLRKVKNFVSLLQFQCFLSIM